MLLLLGGIALGVYLVQNRTNILPKAQEGPQYIQIVDKNGNPITETEDPNVYLKITLPPGWELPPEKTSGLIPPLVKEAYAEGCPQSGEGTTTTFGNLTYDKCIDNQGGTNTTGTLCSSASATKYRCYYSNNSNCISGKDLNDFNYSCPAKSGAALQSAPSCKDSCGACPAVYTCGQQTYDTCDTSPCQQPGATADTTFNCYAKDNSNCSGLNSYKCNSCATNPNTNNANPQSAGEQTVVDYVNCRKCSADGSSCGPEGSDFGPNSGSVEWCNCAKKYRPEDYYRKTVYEVCLKSRTGTRILDALFIGSFSRNIASQGSDNLKITSNFSEYLNKPIPWVLGALPLNIEKDQSKIFIKFVSYYQDDKLKKDRVVEKEITSEVEILFKNPNYKPPRSPSPTPISTPADNTSDTPEPNYNYREKIPAYKVDVYLHKSLGDQNKAETWVRDTVNNFINNRFLKAGINKQLQFGKAFKNEEGTDCPQDVGSKRCNFSGWDNKIRTWIYTNCTGPLICGTGYAYSGTAQIGLSLPNWFDSQLLGRVDKQLLTHEVGHMFGLPDYYFEDVAPDNNKVVPIGISPYIKDVMYNFFGDYSETFSWTSREFANRAGEIPLSSSEGQNPLIKIARDYTPARTTLKIVDDQGNPLWGIRVEVFSEELGSKGMEISNSASNTSGGITNREGEVVLGDYYNLFMHGSSQSNPAFAAFLRVSYRDQVRYMAVTRSYLNYLYFKDQEKGGSGQYATIKVPFSSLVSYQPGIKRVLKAPGQPSAAEPELTAQERELLDAHMRQYLQEMK